MKQVFSKRERILAIVSALIIISAAIYIIILHQNLQAKGRVVENTSASLMKKVEDEHKTINYIDTICAEYRKLYQSYRELRYPDPTGVDKYAGLPGSARGQIDECYLPD